MKRLLLALPSLLLILLGSLLIIAWVVKIPFLLQLNSAYVPAVFNSSICLLLLGVALLFYNHTKFQTVSMIIGGLVLALSVLSISQDLLGLNFGIDEFFVKVWIKVITPHPGRMAPNTAVGFSFAGLFFILLPYANKKAIAMTIESCIYLIFLIGILGLVGYIFNIEFLYSLYSYTRMALLTAVGLVIFAIAAWLTWQNTPYSSAWYENYENRKIIFVSSIILLTIALTTGLTSFLSNDKQQMDSMGKSFQQILEGRIIQLVNNVERVNSEIKQIRDNALFQQVFSKRSSIGNSEYNALMQLFIDEGFSGVKVYDAKNNLITTKGKFIDEPDMRVPLNLPNTPILLWKKDWYLHVTSLVDPKDKSRGFLEAEWPLTEYGKTLVENLDVGPTEEYRLCTIAGNDIAKCFPSRLSPAVTYVSRTVSNQPTPTDYSLKGEKGVGITYDYRGQRVFAAYSPVGNSGLGMTLKIDLKDLYQPFLNDLRFILPIIFATIFCGILLLRWSLSPLMRKILKTERELSVKNKQLQDSQERFDLAVRGSQVGIWDWQVGTDQIFYSPQLKEMMGYADSELPNSFAESSRHIHPDDALRVRDSLIAHLKNHAPYKIEYRIRIKSGRYHWFQVRGQALWDRQGRAVRMAGSIIDITEQKRTQQREATMHIVTQILSEASTFEEAIPKIIRAICEGMNWGYGGAWIADYQTNKLRNIGVWSRPLSKLKKFAEISEGLQFGQDEGVPGRVWKLAKPNWVVMDKIDETKHPRIEAIKEAGLNTAFCFPILLGYKILGVIEFFTTEKLAPDELVIKAMESLGPQIGQFIQRKNVENELRESEAMTSAILQSASDGIVTVDDYGTIVSCNSQTEKMFGYAKQELQEKNLNEIMPEIVDKLSKLEGKPASENIALHRNGEPFDAELSVSGMLVKNQHHYVCVIRDITERKKIIALKNEFVSVVSHELRTPLTSIRGSLALILGGAVGEFTVKAKKLLEIANNNCERLLLLINDILDIEKIEAGKMAFDLKPVKINEVIVNAIEANQMYADKFAVKLRLVKSESDVKVNVDSSRLMQVLTNLISNAAKFSSPGKEVTISIELINNDRVRVSVKDAGSGIPEAFKENIFKKFSQADTSDTRNKGGTGLGLSISRAIIEKLHGELNFKDTPGGGATFYFDLPIWQPHDVKSRAKTGALPEHQINLLICEDDEYQAAYISKLLQSVGYNVDIAYNGEEARKLLSIVHYDALLLDLLLPDQDGFSFIRELRAQESTQSLPIIVISAIAETGRSLFNGEAISIVDWLDKPVDLEKLLKAIKSIKIDGDELPRVLHIEDEKEIRDVVSDVLSHDAHVIGAEDLKTAREKLEQEKFDLIILDLLLPDGNGAEILPLLARKHLPVVVFSSIELDRDYAKYVSETLLKSRTSKEDLLTIIKYLLKEMV